MATISGLVTLNGIDDEGLALAFKFKAEHDNLFTFNPQEMQPSPVSTGTPGKNKIVYNAMTFRWASPEGLNAVIELLTKLEHHHSGHKAA